MFRGWAITWSYNYDFTIEVVEVEAPSFCIRPTPLLSGKRLNTSVGTLRPSAAISTRLT
jgi:hypothetical protein